MSKTPANWIWKKLGDLADFIGGVAYKPTDITTEGIRILRGGNLQNGDILKKEDDVYLPIKYKDTENQLRKYDTIIVSSTGSVDALAKAATCFEENPNTQIGAFLRIIRPKEEKYAMLVSIWCTSQHFRNYMINCAKGTSINNIRTDFLEDFNILVPSDDDLQGMSLLYLNYEKKIALNRQINANLEALARQLYDYWFVQFDFPDANGKPYKSSGGKMVYNEKLKRDIPEGWEGCNICMVADILSGGTPSKQQSQYWVNGTIPFFGPTDYSGNVFQLCTAEQITEDGLKHCASSLFNENTIIITARGSIGKLVIVGTPMAMNQSCYALKSRKGEYEYLYFLTKQLIEHLKTKGTGSVFKSIITSDIENSILCIGDDAIITEYCKITAPIMKAIKKNTEEIVSLTRQRDELLPLLMNGQVTVE